MAKYVNAGDCIECSKSLIAVRKATAGAYIKTDGLDGIVRGYFKYKFCLFRRK